MPLQPYFNNILIVVIAASLTGTVAGVIFAFLYHAKRLTSLQSKLNSIEQQYEEQSHVIIETIASSQPVIEQIHESINRLEELARTTPTSAEIRHEANNLRSLVAGLDELIVVQNIEEGLKLREYR